MEERKINGFYFQSSKCTKHESLKSKRSKQKKLEIKNIPNAHISILSIYSFHFQNTSKLIFKYKTKNLMKVFFLA